MLLKTVRNKSNDYPSANLQFFKSSQFAVEILLFGILEFYEESNLRNFHAKPSTTIQINVVLVSKCKHSARNRRNNLFIRCKRIRSNEVDLTIAATVLNASSWKRRGNTLFVLMAGKKPSLGARSILFKRHIVPNWKIVRFSIEFSCNVRFNYRRPVTGCSF